MDSILKNNIWVLTDLPPDAKLISCKWFFKKNKVNGTTDKFKARLFAKEFTHKKGNQLF